MKRPYLGLCLAATLLLAGCAPHGYQVGEMGVVLYLRHRSAHSVALCASLDGFQPHPARHAPGDLWEVVMPADAGFSYFFIVDGAVFALSCAISEGDGYGSKNCLFDPDL